MLAQNTPVRIQTLKNNNREDGERSDIGPPSEIQLPPVTKEIVGWERVEEMRRLRCAAIDGTFWRPFR